RINVGFAALQMNAALGLSASAYGFGAGIFFLSYTLFEVPSNVVLARIGARLWIARIMITWGLVSSSMMLVRGAGGFYALRFLLEGVPAVVLGFVVLFYLTEHPKDATWLTDDERSALVSALRADGPDPARTTDTVRGALGSGRIWLLSVVYFTIPVALYAFGF